MSARAQTVLATITLVNLIVQHCLLPGNQIHFYTKDGFQGVPNIVDAMLGKIHKQVDQGHIRGMESYPPWGKTLITLVDNNGYPFFYPVSIEAVNDYGERDFQQGIWDHASYHNCGKFIYAAEIFAAWKKSNGRCCWCIVTCKESAKLRNHSSVWKKMPDDPRSIKCIGILIPNGQGGFRFVVVVSGGVAHLEGFDDFDFGVGIANGEKKWWLFGLGLSKWCEFN